MCRLLFFFFPAVIPAGIFQGIFLSTDRPRYDTDGVLRITSISNDGTE